MTVWEALQLAALANFTAWAGSALGAFAAFWPLASRRDAAGNIRVPWVARPGTTAVLLGFAAGVMIGASLLGLIPEAEALADSYWDLGQMVVGFAAGVGLLLLLDLVIPHQHPGAETPDHGAGDPLAASLIPRSTGLLIALALILHNIPEGMAVGASAVVAGEGSKLWSVVWAISIHNVVEGVLVALALRLSGFSLLTAFTLGQVAAASLLFSGLAAAALVGSLVAILPFALAMAAGAMIYISVEELLPEAYRLKRGNGTAFGVCAGVILVILLG